MPNRRPLVQHADGYFEENPLGDVLQPFGNIDFQSTYKGINHIDPTNPQDVATKAYVDAVATGLDVKASVRVSPTADLSTFTSSGSGVGKTLTAPTDSATHNTQDGVLLVVGNRVLVATAGATTSVADSDNGIYTVFSLGNGAGTSFVLTRATDFDQNAEVTAGAFTFVAEGTVNADTGWVLVTNDPITVDTTALQWSLFSTTTIYTFDQGLSLTTGSVKVELDTAAAAQTAGAGGGSSGLEFDVNSASGKLRAAVHATAGIERTGTGLGARLNGTTLQSAAAGLSVKGLPSLFEINAIATGASVTAANLTDVTDGGDASTLHTHASVGAVAKDQISSEAFSAFDPIANSATSGKVMQARANSDARAKVKGVAMAAAGAADVTVSVVFHGTAAGAISGATPGAIYYVGATGGLTATMPGAGNRIIQVGTAETAANLWVQIQDFGKKAA